MVLFLASMGALQPCGRSLRLCELSALGNRFLKTLTAWQGVRLGQRLGRLRRGSSSSTMALSGIVSPSPYNILKLTAHGVNPTRPALHGRCIERHAAPERPRRHAFVSRGAPDQRRLPRDGRRPSSPLSDALPTSRWTRRESNRRLLPG
jgi:hypothetical protein